MILNGIVLSSDVSSMMFYDQMTGAPQKSSFSVRLTVLDADTDEKYDCQFNDFAGLDELKDLRDKNAPPQAIEDAVNRLRASLPPKMTPLTIEVRKVRVKKGFMSMACRLLNVAVPAGRP